MEVVNDLRLTALSIIPDYDAGAIRVSRRSPAPATPISSFSVKDGQRTILSIDLDPDKETLVSLPGFKSWSPESPFLYGVMVEVRRKDRVFDSVHSHFGMRKIDIANDQSGFRAFV
ncbi:MAG: hypothetical protein MZW92_59435 [Comamonadaceae bacterium]|nr:hypothetical protein [Comamonadaceae bacterium]